MKNNMLTNLKKIISRYIFRKESPRVDFLDIPKELEIKRTKQEFDDHMGFGVSDGAFIDLDPTPKGIKI